MKKVLALTVPLLLAGQTVYAKGMADIRASLANIVDQAYHRQANQNHLITLAARNKMLSQQIAKEAVMMAYGSDRSLHRARMLEAAKRFDAALTELQKADPDAKPVLEEVAAEWAPFYRHVKKGHAVDVAYIIAHNEKLLRLSHKLTQTLKNGMVISDTLNKVVEHTLKIADRQRMLTQKMFKEKLLIHYGVDPKRNEVRLKGSIILFENGLKGLMEGEKRRGLVKITNKKVHATLLEMWRLWSDVQALYRQSDISDKAMEKLAHTDPKLLQKSEEVVRLVENALEL